MNERNYSINLDRTQVQTLIKMIEEINDKGITGLDIPPAVTTTLKT